MKSILTIECYRPTSPAEIEKDWSEIVWKGFVYRLIPLPESGTSHFIDGDSPEDIADMLFDGTAGLHEWMQAAIQRKEYAHSEHENHYIMHIVIDEQYDSDDCLDVTLLGVLDTEKLSIK